MGWLLHNAVVSALAALHAFLLTASTAHEGRRWYARWYGLCLIVAAVILSFGSLRAFVAEPFRVPGLSMAPFLPRGAYVVVAKHGFGKYAAYGLPIARRPVSAVLALGDVVVVESPDAPGTKYTRRVAGLPGDHVEYKARHLFVNGTPVATSVPLEGQTFYALEESLGGVKYLATYQGDVPTADFSAVVGERQVVLLGDNRDESVDSRMWGAVDIESLYGRVIYVLRP